jgi:hypothetical protein
MTISSEIIHELHETIELLKKKYDEAYHRGYDAGYIDGRRDEHDRSVLYHELSDKAMKQDIK